MQHALLLLAHLQNALDLQDGGQPARVLEKFYSIARARTLEAQSNHPVDSCCRTGVSFGFVGRLMVLGAVTDVTRKSRRISRSPPVREEEE